MTSSGYPDDVPRSANFSGSRRSMAPTRDSEATLSALVDSLLNKGVYLDLDAIITVAEIPLIGISLRAALASMETMLEYGLMNDWDERTRAWARRVAHPGVGLGKHEEIVTRMPGSYLEERLGSGTWRPGTVYLTTHRLLVFRREPETVLWQIELDQISDVRQISERTSGGQDAPRILIVGRGGATAHLTAARADELQQLIQPGDATHRRETMAGLGELPRRLPEARRTTKGIEPGARGGAVPDIGEGSLHFREARSTGPVWRRGVGRCDSKEGFRWTGEGERRPGVRLDRPELRSLRQDGEIEGIPAGMQALVVDTPQGEVWFADTNIEQWKRWLSQLRSEEGHERAQDR